MPELLSPAGSYSCAKVAIENGADAIYIGATNFGARKNASNSIDDILKLKELVVNLGKTLILISSIYI